MTGSYGGGYLTLKELPKCFPSGGTILHHQQRMRIPEAAHPCQYCYGVLKFWTFLIAV